MSEDFINITSCLYRYALGIDTRDWELYRSIFTDRVHMDFSSYDGSEVADMTADEWVAAVRPLFEGLDATQHLMTNPMVDVKGDEASCRMYMQAAHFLQTSSGSPEYTIGGYYNDRLVRTPKGWLISAVTLNVLWHRGNPDIMRLAMAACRT